MTRQEKIDRMQRNGYKVVIGFSGNCSAEKGQYRYNESSITALHKTIFGY